MSDGGGVKGAVGQIAQDVGEALAEPAGDIAEQAAEQAGAVFTGPKPVPQDPVAQQKFQEDQAKREEENQKKMQWAQSTIARYQKIDEEQARVRMQKKQKEQMKQQEEQQEEQAEQVELQQHEQKSADMDAVQRKARVTEIKGGVGG